MLILKSILTVLAATSLAQAAPFNSTSTSTLEKRASHAGTGTVYDQGGAPGSCGIVSSDNDMVVALSSTFNGNKQNCGKKIKVTNQGPYQDSSVKGKGRSVIVTVRDLCTGCAANDVDLSHAAWNSLTLNHVPSRVRTSWKFV